MLTRKMMPMAEADKFTGDRRIVIWREEEPWSRAKQGEHMFILWTAPNRRYDFDDAGAESPFTQERDEDGEETWRVVVKKGLIVFPVDLYDHSGLSFSLGSDKPQAHGPKDPDLTHGAAFLYISKERFISFQGEERWMQVPTRADWSGEWRPAKDFDEFKKLTLEPVAKQEIDELNLIHDGSCYGYDVEIRAPWLKRYADGRTVHGCDWESEPGTGCGGYLTEHADDIEFPRDPDIPVYYNSDVFLSSSLARGLHAYEYTIPEFVIRVNVDPPTKCECIYYAGAAEGGAARWTRDVQQAKVFYRLYEAWETARKVLNTDNDATVRRACVEKDNWKVTKEDANATEKAEG